MDKLQGLFVFWSLEKGELVGKIYVKAGLLTVGIGLVLVGLFMMWSEKSRSKIHGADQVAFINALESQGMHDFEGELLDGGKLKLSEYKGKTIVLSFWASWCGPCIEEFPSMIKMVEQLDGKLVLIAVSEDARKDDIQEFLKMFPGSENPNIKIVWDHDLAIGKTYNAERLPESYVVGPDFKMKRKIVGSIPWDTKDAIEYLKSF